MFSLMGNCWSSRNKGLRRHLTLAVLGLDNAGKTVTTNILQGESTHTAPTVGFEKSELVFGRYNLTFFDLGGGKKIRAIWEKYLAEIHGIVYLVDSSDADRIEESTTVFRQLLENSKVKGKPVLLLANKQDKEGAMDEVDICDQMKLEEIVNANKCPCRVEMCTATKGTGRKKDPAIKEGLQWLCDMIRLDFERLGPRVEEDMKRQAEERRKELEEKRERVRKIKEEREKAEAEERIRTGAPARPESPTDQPINGDPFKRINLEDLQKKEAALKAEKKRQKLQKTANKNENQQSQIVTTNRLSNSNSANLSKGLHNHDDDDDEDIIITSPSPRHSKLPPLHNSSHHREENLEGPSLKPVAVVRNEDRANGRRIPPIGTAEGFPNGHTELFSVQNSHNLKETTVGPLDSPDKPVEEVKKRRRRKVKKNKLAPLDGGIEDTPRPLESHTALPWHTPNPRTHPARLGTPKLQTTQENYTDHQGGMMNWAMVEDLTEPTLDINYSNRYGQPNFDREDIVT